MDEHGFDAAQNLLDRVQPPNAAPDSWFVAMRKGLHAWTAHLQGEDSAAEKLAQQALDVAARQTLRLVAIDALELLAALACAKSAVHKARQVFRSAQRLRSETGA
jgi:hypothetical protein